MWLITCGHQQSKATGNLKKYKTTTVSQDAKDPASKAGRPSRKQRETHNYSQPTLQCMYMFSHINLRQSMQIYMHEMRVTNYYVIMVTKKWLPYQCSLPHPSHTQTCCKPNHSTCPAAMYVDSPYYNKALARQDEPSKKKKKKKSL